MNDGGLVEIGEVGHVVGEIELWWVDLVDLLAADCALGRVAVAADDKGGTPVLDHPALDKGMLVVREPDPALARELGNVTSGIGAGRVGVGVVYDLVIVVVAAAAADAADGDAAAAATRGCAVANELWRGCAGRGVAGMFAHDNVARHGGCGSLQQHPSRRGSSRLLGRGRAAQGRPTEPVRREGGRNRADGGARRKKRRCCRW
jgi:hypothetical protein